MAKKKKVRDSLRRDIEKEFMYGFKEEYLQKSQELTARYKVDRGKVLRSIIENEYMGALEIDEKKTKRLLEKVGVVIYKRASPREIPYVIVFTDVVGKRSAIDDAEEGSKLFKRLFPGAITIFAAIDPEPEEVKKKRYKSLDYVIIGKNLEEAWDKFDEILQELFPLEE